MKNVISFSLWGDLPIYNVGAVENVKLRPYIYPGWHCRYYVDTTVSEKTIQELKRFGAEIKVMPEGDGFKRLFWRFYVASDKTVDRFIVRDCDSRINLRERMAVEEWMKSDSLFHIMRDNRCHTLPIQGGMWGGVGNVLINIERAIEHFLNENPSSNYKNHYNIDQIFLNNKVWPKIIHSHMAHSIIKIVGNEKNFSHSLDDGMFVGQVVDENNIPMSDKRINPLI